jgi:pimeloyl-ACP methyl ester carboxylesterase
VAVALVSPTGPAVVDAIRRPVRGGLRLPWFAGMLGIMRAAAALGPVADAMIGLLDRTGLLASLSAPLFASRRRLDGSVTAALAHELRPASFVAAARAAGRYDLSRWAAITAPVVSVRGERDVFSGAGDAGEFARRIRRFTEHRLADAGHFAAIEQPDSVLELLGDPLRQAPDGNGGAA